MTRPVVYPLREGRRPKPDYLRWSLRSVAAHLPHTGVVLVGGTFPEWANPDTVTHIETTQGSRKFENIGTNLHAALDAHRGGEVYWFNDDMFLLEDVDEIPLMDRGPLGPFCERIRLMLAKGGNHHTDHKAYLKGMEGQRQILREWGFDEDTPSCDFHVPIPLIVDELVETLDRVTATLPTHPHGHFRMIYGAGRETVRHHDNKPANLKRSLADVDGPYVSTYVRTWARGVIGAELRARFPDPSPYER